MPRPEVAPLYDYATSAIRRSLEKRMAPAPEVQTPAQEDEMTPEDRAALEQHYQSLK